MSSTYFRNASVGAVAALFAVTAMTESANAQLQRRGKSRIRLKTNNRKIIRRNTRPKPGTSFTKKKPGTLKLKPGLGKGLKKIGKIPKLNKAMYLGWRGEIKTKLKFTDFFDKDHTIMAWYMPQFPHAYSGPLFSVDGSGQYFVGQGDYRDGNGGFKKKGDPLFVVRVGNAKRKYLLPELKPGQWAHIALVRRFGKFYLYVNGQWKQPVSDGQIQVGVSFGNKPNGTLRFGRSASPNQQMYGLLDDVVVFNRQLTIGEIAFHRNKKRMIGNETGLIAGWCFDKPKSNEPPLPAKLNSWHKRYSAYSMPVSTNRSSVKDAKSFDNPLVIGVTAKQLKLPFAKNEVWRVIQGCDSPSGSHNGYAAFCWDFVRATGATAHKPVTHAVSGKIVAYNKYGAVPEGKIEHYFIKVKYAPGEYVGYLHLEKSSFPKDIKGGAYDTDAKFWFFTEAMAPNATQGSYVAKLGPKGRHLHFAAGNRLKNGVTIPVAFVNYYASNDKGKTWFKVFRGMPKAGQWIKRIQ